MRLLPFIIRLLDVFFSLVGLLFGLPLILLITLGGLLDTGSPIFLQTRLGRHKSPFVLVKFRTMKLGALSVPTHLVSNLSVTRFGRFLRRTKLDEIPQLWNVLKGEMSLVGPRPGLPNHHELTVEREKRGVFECRPGITGLAQVQKVDMSTPKFLAETDQQMIETLTLTKYFSYIVKTLVGYGGGDRRVDD